MREKEVVLLPKSTESLYLNPMTKQNNEKDQTEMETIPSSQDLDELETENYSAVILVRLLAFRLSFHN